MADAIARRKTPDSYTPLVVQELERIEADLGGRTELVGMLTLAPLSPDLRYILGLLGDPKNRQKTLAAICALGNVLPGELLKHLGSAALLRGKVLAQQAIGSGIAAVTQDLMRRAAPYEQGCGQCQGTGTFTPEPSKDVPNPVPGPCDICRGSGQLLYLPDLERQKVAIEMAHLLPKGGGLQILNQQINSGSGASGGGALEQMQQLTDQLLYGEGSGMPPRPEDPADDPADPSVEGEVVDGD